MRIEELVSDWELDEIRDELSQGYAPDVVAFHHGIEAGPVMTLARRMQEARRRRGEYVGARHDVWTDAEKAFVEDNYPNHNASWPGWQVLGRSWNSIKKRACMLGVSGGRHATGTK